MHKDLIFLVLFHQGKGQRSINNDNRHPRHDLTQEDKDPDRTGADRNEAQRQ